MATLSDTRVIVNFGQSECQAVTLAQVHHHDFPEMHAEGTTAAEAGAQLLNLLIRTRDNVADGFHQEAVKQAICDVEEFIKSHP